MLDKFFQQLFSKKKKTGFSLLEVIIAIFVLTTGILAVMSLIYKTVASSSFSSNRLIAAYLAQEGIEIVRNIRDTNWIQIQQKIPGKNWNDGLGLGTYQADYDDPSLTSITNPSYLNIETNNGFYGYDNGTQTSFQRTITISNGPITDSLEIRVDVSWRERGVTYNFPPVIERLYNWYK